MKTALIFPGQGSQKPGMGKEVYEASETAKGMFAKANEILGFDIAELMFNGTDEDLKRTSVTQPAVYIHSVVLHRVHGLEGDMAAGHSLGEFSALAAAGVISFEDGLRLVKVRADAMQRACDAAPSTMAAIIGLEDAQVEELCEQQSGIVVPANYNSLGQLVISGGEEAVDDVVLKAKEAGAKVAKRIPVNGAFHSPYMEVAARELNAGIEAVDFHDAKIPVYQNVTAQPETEKDRIKANLIAQLTGPVRWTQTVEQMVKDGAGKFIEIGPGNVLQGLVKRIDSSVERSGISA